MKALRASKKLIISIVCFAVSVVFCLGLCLAWFAINDKVGGEGSKVSAIGSDIVRFDVNVYYLDSSGTGFVKADTGNVKGLLQDYNVDDGEDGKLTSDKDEMRPYGALGAKFATAVLFEIEYEIIVSSKTYRIFASNTSETFGVKKNENKEDSFDSALSNVIGYYNATLNNSLYSKVNANADALTFVDENYNKNSFITLKKNITPNTADGKTGHYVGEALFIMDYIDDPFLYLSSLMIQEGGSLNSRLLFDGDLTISMETYDPNNETDPVPPEITDPDKPEDPDSKSWSVSVSGGKGVVSGGSGASVVYYTSNSDNGGDNNTSKNAKDLKLDKDDTTITITLSDLKAGQVVSLTVYGYTGSSTDGVGNAVGVKVSEANNVTATSASPSEIEFDGSTTASDLGSGKFMFTVDADGTVSIVIVRSKKNTTRITGFDISVK